MAVPDVGPAHRVLTARVARRFHLDGRSKTEIAGELGLSRFKVARLLDEARATGVVQIEIRHHGVVDVDLSSRLRDAYGLRHAVAVDGVDGSDPVAARTLLGTVTAQLLTEVVGPADVVGLAWARSVCAMVAAAPRLPAVPVVQLTGTLAPADSAAGGPADTSVDMVRDLARAAHGTGHVFYAPFTVPDAATARALRRQPDVAAAFDRIPDVTVAVAGLGAWQPGGSTLHDAVDERDRAALRELGVCADISGVFVGADGTPIRTDLADRMIGVSARQMSAIPEVIVIAYGPGKEAAARAALGSGLVGGVVLPAALASALVRG
jgi:DNA-binding transcriptional regulator LsrR (DeoR family)